MKLYSYIVARDFGFAPNPFFGVCTLATCKPRIRKNAQVGDWIIGTGAKTRYKLSGHLIYAMQVEETLDFTSYWNDPRFVLKRPVLRGSLMQLYGDNIYRRWGQRWIQADSHHSLEGGKANKHNIENDTKTDRLLISRRFVYFGENAPMIPRRLRSFGQAGKDVCCPRRNHIVQREARLITGLVRWLEGLDKWGLQGLPLEFARHQKAASEENSGSRRRRTG